MRTAPTASGPVVGDVLEIEALHRRPRRRSRRSRTPFPSPIPPTRARHPSSTRVVPSLAPGPDTVVSAMTAPPAHRTGSPPPPPRPLRRRRWWSVTGLVVDYATLDQRIEAEIATAEPPLEPGSRQAVVAVADLDGITRLWARWRTGAVPIVSPGRPGPDLRAPLSTWEFVDRQPVRRRGPHLGSHLRVERGSRSRSACTAGKCRRRRVRLTGPLGKRRRRPLAARPAAPPRRGSLGAVAQRRRRWCGRPPVPVSCDGDRRPARLR